MDKSTHEKTATAHSAARTDQEKTAELEELLAYIGSPAAGSLEADELVWISNGNAVIHEDLPEASEAWENHFLASKFGIIFECQNVQSHEGSHRWKIVSTGLQACMNTPHHTMPASALIVSEKAWHILQAAEEWLTVSADKKELQEVLHELWAVLSSRILHRGSTPLSDAVRALLPELKEFGAAAPRVEIESAEKWQRIVEEVSMMESARRSIETAAALIGAVEARRRLAG